MGLDRSVVDRLVELVCVVYPNWSGFADPRFLKEERDYKVAAVQKATGDDGLLTEAALRADLEGHALTSFADRFEKVAATNLLFHSVPLSGDMNALFMARDREPEVFESFCRALFDLLWGDGESPERLARYLQVVATLDLPSKWTFPTYFLFFTSPHTDVFVKPMAMQRVAKEVAAPWTTNKAPTADEYARILEWCTQLRASLEEYGPRDMIDIQSFLWVAANALVPKPAEPEPPTDVQHWKIAPGEGAWNWETCRDGGFIDIGWEDLGDIGELTQQEFDERMRAEIARHSDWTEGARQVWRFAHDLATGDLVVANRGKSTVLGFGRVTGPYEFVEGIRHGHRRPVDWFDRDARLVDPPQMSWMRTLMPLTREKYEELVALPPADPPLARPLAPPFTRIFGDRDEADAMFDLMAEALRALGVAANDDERFSITYNSGSRQLTLDFADRCIIRCGPSDKASRLQLALPSDAVALEGIPVDFRFSLGPDEAPTGLRSIEPGGLTREIKDLFLTTAHAFGIRFGHHKRCNQRKFHSAAIGSAILDQAKRPELLGVGIPTTPPTVTPDVSPGSTRSPAQNPAFTPAARDLLVAMAADPTKNFYTAHKADLTKHVQEPVQHVLRAVAKCVEPELREALETQKWLFGSFLKNDHGQGGAWPWYWGAFYPKGQKRSQGCQLYVSANERGLVYGFSIGDYASDDRKRFVSGATVNRRALTSILRDTIDAPEFAFGQENESLGTHLEHPIDGLDLAGWLERIDEVGPQVHVVVPWDDVVQIEQDDLIRVVAAAFDRLFPLALLGMLDDPMEAIRSYLEGHQDGDEDELNPPYSLDELAAETSLPKEQLKSWVRAIERKGQAILYGPPGTGKTYVAERLAKHLVAGGTGITELVQFHPAYAYEDFMQGIRPKAREGGGLDYPVVDGRFKQFCQQARASQGLSVLIIDEVNRANLARVFGELMYLLEYRDKSIPLASGGNFSIPGNVRIIGTMNTADRSIALVDHALRRRFAFLALYPDYQMLTDYHAKNGGDFDPAKLIAVLRELNVKIGDHHYEVGTSFFMRADIADQLEDIWRMEIEPYLEEYFFDQQGTVASYRWSEVQKKLGAE